MVKIPKRMELAWAIKKFAEYGFVVRRGGAILKPDDPEFRFHGFWTEARISRLKELRAMGAARKQIAEELGTTKGAIGAKINQLKHSG